ncbi:MAG: glycosyltransferase family 39 protein, partial [Planctomycetaceae bacterium]|nr:glycosyltransferase family 39 protein [Planctomycetaceae bacterium]
MDRTLPPETHRPKTLTPQRDDVFWSIPWRRQGWLIAAMLLGTCVRGVLLWQYSASSLSELYRADHAFYRQWGLAISQGVWSPGHVFEQGPLYAYILGGFYALLGKQDLFLLACQMLAGLSTVWLVDQIGRVVFDEWTARIAAFVTAICAPLVFFEGLVMKTWLTPLLSTLIVWLLITPSIRNCNW